MLAGINLFAFQLIRPEVSVMFSDVARVIISGGQNASAEGASYCREVGGHAPPQKF